ncbi:MAG: energy-coupling factor ABC transporter permease [Myxococcota bacterium]|nr:energy-coupling factor ABC transporter permease [Myxococcota bacterium]
MHLAEGMLPLGQAIGWSAAGAAALAWSIRGEQKARRAPTHAPAVMTGVTSLLFAVTLLPLPVPVVGATSHICLTPILALLVGVRRIVWPTFFVLLLQAIFFAHGGLTTLGVNTLTLGLLGPLITIGLWAAMRRMGANSTIGLAIACGVGGLAVYVTDAFVLAVALADVAEPMTTVTAVIVGFAPVQVPLAVLEAAASVAMVRVIASRRPDLLPTSLQGLKAPPTSSATVALVVGALGLGGCSYEGIDGTVFGATAEAAGRAPTDSMLDLSQGEVGLAMSILILFGLGFIAGRSWERIFRRGSDALPR